jgi:glycosyltransferase involved in cell wall biosynthesis
VSKPRVLFLSRGRIRLPLEPWLAHKWDALSEVFDVRALNAGCGGGDERFHLLPERSLAFYPLLPLEVARELRRHPADVLIASDPYIGAAALAGRALGRSSAKVVVELHGDPRTFARLYGSTSRQWVAPATDAIARAAIRRADATRAVSTFTARLVEEQRGVPPTAVFLAYSDLSAFAGSPPVSMPEARTIVFVGALEPYKNIDGLAAAWRAVAAADPAARLTIVGRGSRRSTVDALAHDLPGQVTHHAELAPPDVASEIDAARALVLPSYPEGLGRVVLESFARGRGVIGTDGGGIPDMVTDEVDGLLVPPHDTQALVVALRRILYDRALAAGLGARARVTYDAWHQTPGSFAAAYRDLAERVLAGAR